MVTSSCHKYRKTSDKANGRRAGAVSPLPQLLRVHPFGHLWGHRRPFDGASRHARCAGFRQPRCLRPRFRRGPRAPTGCIIASGREPLPPFGLGQKRTAQAALIVGAATNLGSLGNTTTRRDCMLLAILLWRRPLGGASPSRPFLGLPAMKVVQGPVACWRRSGCAFRIGRVTASALGCGDFLERREGGLSACKPIGPLLAARANSTPCSN